MTMRAMNQMMLTNDAGRCAAGRYAGIRALGLFLAAATVLALAAPAWGQRTRDRSTDQWDDFRPVAPTPIEESRRAEDAFAEDAQRSRAGLLREGSLILAMRATVQFDDETDSWYARLHAEERGEKAGETRDMRVLPNSFLAELVQVIEATPSQRITFELTGEALVYDSHNHLLLRSPARVVGLERIETEGAAPAPPTPQPPPADAPRPRYRRNAAEVMRELERESGPLHRTPLVPRQPVPVESPGDQPRDGESPAHGAPEHNAAGDQRQWREGTLIVQRRGRITREAMGAWRFVFDADAQGLSDPPLTLMPCLLLERIERFARQAGPTAAVLISGEVFVHDGRAHLLPSAFQLPRERTPLN